MDAACLLQPAVALHCPAPRNSTAIWFQFDVALRGPQKIFFETESDNLFWTWSHTLFGQQLRIWYQKAAEFWGLSMGCAGFQTFPPPAPAASHLPKSGNPGPWKCGRWSSRMCADEPRVPYRNKSQNWNETTTNTETPPTTAMQDQKVNNETVNQEQSLTLVRNLIRVTISQIAYMRNIFPSKCFEECKSIWFSKSVIVMRWYILTCFRYLCGTKTSKNHANDRRLENSRKLAEWRSVWSVSRVASVFCSWKMMRWLTIRSDWTKDS